MNVVVTGAGRGLGLAVSQRLAAEEHRVFGISRTYEALELNQVSKTVDSSHLLEIRFDLATGNYEQQLIPALKKWNRKIDVLINNAGSLINRSFDSTTLSDFRQMMESNYINHISVIKQLRPFFNPDGTHIINIGSMGGYQGSAKFAGLSAYSASKAALSLLTECLAEEWKETSIRVNCLALGSVQTDMLAHAFPDYQAPVTAEEMAFFVADFALNGHRFFNGKIIPVALSTP